MNKLSLIRDETIMTENKSLLVVNIWVCMILGNRSQLLVTLIMSFHLGVSAVKDGHVAVDVLDTGALFANTLQELVEAIVLSFHKNLFAISIVSLSDLLFICIFII